MDLSFRPQKPIVIGFTGFAGSGKTTASRFISAFLRFQGFRVGALSFADPLREMLLTVDPYIADGIRLGDELAAFDGWQGAKKSPHAEEIRRLMQCLGTDAIRQQDPAFFIRIAERRVGRALTDGISVVIDDIRFANEALMVRLIENNAQLRGYVIEIVRPEVSEGDHTSERQMPRDLVDAVVVNDGSIVELDQKLCATIRQILALPQGQGAL